MVEKKQREEACPGRGGREEQRVWGSMTPETVSMHIMRDLMCNWIVYRL